MRIFLSFILFFTLIGSSKSQVLEQFRSIEKSKDTMADLRYFKTLDSIIREKLDSFIVFREAGGKRKVKDSVGFIEISIMRNHSGSIFIDISHNSQYVCYRTISLKHANFGNVFAFSFYRSNLILLSIPYHGLRIKAEYQVVLRDLIYPEMTEAVKGEIDRNTTEFGIEVGIVKRYYLDR